MREDAQSSCMDEEHTIIPLYVITRKLILAGCHVGFLNETIICRKFLYVCP